MKKELITLIITLALVIPLTSASLQSNFDEITNYISQYESEEINAPQLIVYIEYIKGKMYEELDKKTKKHSPKQK